MIGWILVVGLLVILVVSLLRPAGQNGSGKFPPRVCSASYERAPTLCPAALSELAGLRQRHEALQEQYEKLMRSQSSSRKLPSRRDESQWEFDACLHELGFSSMQEYRSSEFWLRTKARYRDSDYPQRCLVCACRDFDLHHRTYARLGNEELFDLVPLCRDHHDRLHQLLDADPVLSVKDTHDFLIFLSDHKECVDGLDEEPAAKVNSEAGKPQRTQAAKRWTADEDAELLRCFHHGMTMEQLADRLHRSIGAVEVRLFKLGKLSLSNSKGDQACEEAAE